MPTFIKLIIEAIKALFKSMNVTKWLGIACAVLVLVVVLMGARISHQHDNVTRLESNQAALLDTCLRYQTKSKAAAASVVVLELKKKELEESCTHLTAELKDMGIKLKRAEAIAQNATKTEIQIKTVIKDSIVYVRDTSGVGHLDTTQTFHWKDGWIELLGKIGKDGVLDARVTSCDTLTQVVHRVPHKWWFFKWGCKEIRQEIKSSNPHTKIVYSEYVTVEK